MKSSTEDLTPTKYPSYYIKPHARLCSSQGREGFALMCIARATSRAELVEFLVDETSYIRNIAKTKFNKINEGRVGMPASYLERRS